MNVDVVGGGRVAGGQSLASGFFVFVCFWFLKNQASGLALGPAWGLGAGVVLELNP